MMSQTMRDLTCQHIQLDEIWCYVGKKQRHVKDSDDLSMVGDFWTWVAIDADTKLIPSYRIGKRDAETARSFIDDLQSRLANRIRLNPDGLKLWVEAVEESFGADVDCAQIVESYEAKPIGPSRYGPLKVVSTETKYVTESPDLRLASTSYVERRNLTMRMVMRRFTPLTNAFSKKVENLRAAVAVHFAEYNFVRAHRALRVTPALEAGVTNRIWNIRELVEMAEA